MKKKIIPVFIFLTSIIVPLNAQAGFFSSLAKALGVKDDSVLGQISRTADEIGE